MVFAHRHYLKAGRDTWVHQRSCGFQMVSSSDHLGQVCTESSWNGAANSSGPITGRWVLITWGWSGVGRGSLMWGWRDGKVSGLPTRFLIWRSTLTCHPWRFFQPQGEFWAWAAKTRKLLKDLPRLWEGTECGGGGKAGWREGEAILWVERRRCD